MSALFNYTDLGTAGSTESSVEYTISYCISAKDKESNFPVSTALIAACA